MCQIFCLIMGIPPPISHRPSNVLALSTLLVMYWISHLQVASLLAMEGCLSKFELAENTWSTSIASCWKNPPFSCHHTTNCIIPACFASWLWTGNSSLLCVDTLSFMMLILCCCLLNVCELDSEQQDFSHYNAEHPAELPAFTICFQFVLSYLICENLSNLYIACLESWFCMINLC